MVCVALRFSRRPEPPVSVSIAPLSAFASDEGLLYAVPFAVKENTKLSPTNSPQTAKSLISELAHSTKGLPEQDVPQSEHAIS